MPNGKVDRRALPAPDRSRPGSEKTFVAPRDDLELQLTHIWEEVLGVRPVGVRDNFFDSEGTRCWRCVCSHRSRNGWENDFR